MPLNVEDITLVNTKEGKCTDGTNRNKWTTDYQNLGPTSTTNMPLYPHSILKKPNVSRGATEHRNAQPEPVVDYNTHTKRDDETNQSDNSLLGKEHGNTKQSFVPPLKQEVAMLDRPHAKPGKHTRIN